MYQALHFRECGSRRLHYGIFHFCCFFLVKCEKIFITGVSIVLSTGNSCSEDIHGETEKNGKIVEIDDNFEDPQFCATMACDIYQHLRASEV